MPVILIVDDEKEIADLIETYLENENYVVLKAYNAKSAIEIIQKNQIDLLLLDIMLPDCDGFTLCRKIREKYYFPIIMLTARIEDTDKINGLILGADDYITKPFNPLEMIARIKSQLRRNTKYNICPDANIYSNKEIYDFDGLYISPDEHKCELYGIPLKLTPTEFEILLYLCRKKGKVVSSEELFEKIWGEKYYNSANTVMAHIARLREKMHEQPRKPKFIKTVWGVGYKID